jgi:hypothetical protein
MRALVYQLGFILLGLTVCVSLAGSRGQATPLSQAERQGIFGGDRVPITPGCKTIITTCKDPSGVPNSCAINGKTQLCWMCSMTVTNYQDCDFTQKTYPNCTSTTTTAYCGAIWNGPPTMTGTCPVAQCAVAAGVSCGVQIPTVTGVPCSP